MVIAKLRELVPSIFMKTTLLKSLFKDTAIYGFADFLFKFINFATFPIFTFALTVDEFGLYSLLITFSTLIGLMSMCGLNSAMQRFCLEKHASPETCKNIISAGLWSLLSVSFLIGALLIFGLVFFDDALNNQYQITNQMLFWALLGGISMQINTYCLDVVRIEFRPWKYTLLNFIQNSLLIGLSLYFVIFLRLGVMGYIAATSLAYLLLIPCCIWTIKHRLSGSFNYATAKQMLNFGYPIIFAGFGYWLFGSMDRWMLGELSNYTQVGLYSIAFKISSILVFINFAFGQAWNPIGLKAIHTDPHYKQSYSQIMSLWFCILIVISLFISLFGYEFLMISTPREYWEAAYLLPCICMSLAFYGTTPILAMGISIEGKTYHYSFAIGIAAASNFLLNWWLIPNYGAQGAACATLCSNIILWCYYLWCSQKLHPIPWNIKRLMFGVGGVVIGIAFNLWINHLSWNVEILILKTFFILILLATSLGFCYDQGRRFTAMN